MNTGLKIKSWIKEYLKIWSLLLLQTNSGEEKHINIKWFAILAGLGIGLLLVYYTKPLDIHSLAIMAFSISLSFLGYYFFVKQATK